MCAPVPQAFAHLAGTYKGPFYSPTGAVPTNEVTVTIKADGEVTIRGTNAYNAQIGTLTLKWDGIDDFIAPNLRPDNQGGGRERARRVPDRPQREKRARQPPLGRHHAHGARARFARGHAAP